MYCVTNAVLDEIEKKFSRSNSLLQLACYLDYKDMDSIVHIIKELRGYREAVKKVYDRE